MKYKIKFFTKVYGGSIFLTCAALITGCTNYSLATKQQPKPKTRESYSPETNSAANPQRCQTEQLSVSKVSTNAGAGSVFIIYAFTNKSSSPCNLYGYPGFVLLNSQNQPLKGVKVIRSPIPQQQSPANITLAPNEQASFEIAYNHIRDVGQTCPTSVKILITPPNAYHHFTLPETINACTGKVRVRPVQPGIIQ
ncbi:DUF4232 domain-containing protein [Pelatocladus sp. BLCC-F211]|uniref:DUF4232 domain-containing protein n=1 Tax=Pelatocladus sp. BLCC-F211 TaxID=3342752 RepID=UPI0035B74E45